MLLTSNACYLLGIRVLKLKIGELCQDHVYLFMFLGHLALGLFILVPVVLFGLLHRRNTRQRPPSSTQRLGGFLLLVSVAILISGLLLVRLDGLELDPENQPAHHTLPIVERRAGNQEVAESIGRVTKRTSEMTRRDNRWCRSIGAITLRL